MTQEVQSQVIEEAYLCGSIHSRAGGCPACHELGVAEVLQAGAHDGVPLHEG